MPPNTTYSTQTNIVDPGTQYVRNQTLPDLSVLMRRAPYNPYGSRYNPTLQNKNAPIYDKDGNPVLDASGNPTYELGGYERTGEPLVAGQNADITNAGQAIRDLQGGQAGTFQKASDAFGNAAGMDIYGAGAPAYGQAGQYYNQAAAGKSGLAGQGQYNAATGLYEQAANTNTGGQYQPYGNAATGMYGQSTDALGLSSASPYLQAAGQSSVSNINDYMNPYNEQVVKRIGQLGARNLSENILPSIGSDFIKAGGYGSTRQRDLIGRAIRDSEELTTARQAEALQKGYSEGLTTSAADKLRYGSLANTAGNLGTQQQQNLQTAARGISDIGNNLSTLYGSDATRKIAAGQGLYNIGQSNIQASQSDLSRILSAGTGQAGIGAGLGTLAQANAANQIAVGQGDINLANNVESSRLKQIAALQGVGEQTQLQDQRVIDANRVQAGVENAAPFENIKQGMNIVNNTPSGGTTSTSSTSAPSPSAASQIGSLAVGGIGAYQALKAKGGAIKKGSLKKASYGKLPKRGLSMFARAS